MTPDFGELVLAAFGKIPEAVTADLGDGAYDVTVAGVGSIRLILPARARAGYDFLGWDLVRSIDALAYAVCHPLLVAPEVRRILSLKLGLRARQAAYAWWIKTAEV